VPAIKRRSFAIRRKSAAVVSVALVAGFVWWFSVGSEGQPETTLIQAKVGMGASPDRQSVSGTANGKVLNQGEDVSGATRAAPIESPEKVLSKFQEFTGLNFKLPGSFRYQSLDLDAEVAALAAVDDQQKLSFGVVAYPGSASAEQALSFVSDVTESIAEMKMIPSRPFTPGLDLQPEPDSGISKIQHFSAPSVQDQTLHVILVTRSDGRGTYMFVANGPNSLFDENEGYFDMARQSLKAGKVGALP
jgi:hypothetical protein